MNYKTLKWMIDSLIKIFKCPSCTSSIADSNIEIIWAAWSTINIDIECSKCKKHSIIKAEINTINMPINLWKEQIDWLKNFKEQSIDLLNTKTISDEEIVNLNKKLKKNDLNASDLFNE